MSTKGGPGKVSNNTWVKCPGCGHIQATAAIKKVICHKCKRKYNPSGNAHSGPGNGPHDGDFIKAADIAWAKTPWARGRTGDRPGVRGRTL
jgi:hypothetical protein